MIDELINFLKEQFENNDMFSGAVVFSTMMGVMGSLFYYLRAVPEAIYNRIKRALIYQVSIEETNELYFYVEKWFAHNYSKSYRNVEASLSERSQQGDDPPKTEGDTTKKKSSSIFYKHFEDSFLIFYSGCPIYIHKGREKMENASSIRNAFFNRYIFRGIWAKRAIMKMLEEIRDYNDSLIDEDSINAYMNDPYGNWMRIAEITPKPIDSVILKDKDKILTDVQRYLDNRKWYTDRAIPYKRGYLFHGPPGNGKTTLCTSIAQEFDRNIYFLSISDLGDDSCLKRAFIQLGCKSVLVLEDIDSAFIGREGEDSVTFSGILNCLDGMLYSEDVITILTTNHPEKLDKALIREGRIDMHIEFPNPSREQIEEYLKVFYDFPWTLSKDCEPNFSMAKIQDLCLRNIEDPKNVINLIEKNDE